MPQSHPATGKGEQRVIRRVGDRWDSSRAAVKGNHDGGQKLVNENLIIIVTISGRASKSRELTKNHPYNGDQLIDIHISCEIAVPNARLRSWSQTR